jgi:hypothetical protein
MRTQHFDQLLGNDLVFARLQHERVHSQSRPFFAAADYDRRLSAA